MISTPEVSCWRAQTENESYLVVASDGIFETLTSDDVCNFIGHQKSADYIVNIAFEKGSTDNLSLIVVSFVLM